MIGRITRRWGFIRRYRGSPPWDTGLAPPEVGDIIQQLPPGRAIDLGCGTGASSLALAKAGWQVVGVDFVPSAIRRARERLAAAGQEADLRVADVTRLPGISGPFDLALDIGCYHSLPAADRDNVRERLKELLAPGAIFLLYGFRREGKAGRGLDEREIAALSSEFGLIDRKDSADPSGPASVWLTLGEREVVL